MNESLLDPAAPAMLERAVAHFGTLHIIPSAGLQRDSQIDEMIFDLWSTVIGV